MYALQLASGSPSALVDWNNNYGDDPNKCVFFHCGNWAKAFLPDIQISTAPILGSVLGEENTYGALAGRTPGGRPVTFARVSTDDRARRIVSYVGEGRFTDDPLETFGTRAVVEVPELQSLMRVHLPPRIRAPCGDECFALSRACSSKRSSSISGGTSIATCSA